jgi:hypothetical protein
MDYLTICYQLVNLVYTNAQNAQTGTNAHNVPAQEYSHQQQKDVNA